MKLLKRIIKIIKIVFMKQVIANKAGATKIEMNVKTPEQTTK